MASGTSVAEVRAIPYDLPRSDEVGLPPPLPSGVMHAEPVVAVFSVTITKDGVVAVNGKVVPPDQLPGLAKEARAKDDAVRAVIHADRSASWGSVVHVIDLVKQGGIARLAFAVSPLDPSTIPRHR